MRHLTQFYALTLLLTTTLTIVKAQNFDDKYYLLKQQLPDWFVELYETEKIGSNYKISDYLNPFYLEADFDGDNKIDIAVLIEEVKTKKRGILICHSQTKNVYVVGAGKAFGNGDDDFGWMNIWKVYRESKVEPGVGEIEIIILKGQAMYVGKSGAASALIYWTGKEYKWYQQGD